MFRYQLNIQETTWIINHSGGVSLPQVTGDYRPSGRGIKPSYIHTGRDPAERPAPVAAQPQPDGVLGEPETVAADQPGMIIEEGEQIGLRPPIRGPCKASPIQRSLGFSASNRPNTTGVSPAAGPISSHRRNSRSRVDSEGAHPALALGMRATWAAVRAGFSA